MKMCYDEKPDALYLRLDDSKIVESAEVEPGIVLDCDANNQVVGVEIPRIQERVPAVGLKHLDFMGSPCRWPARGRAVVVSRG